MSDEREREDEEQVEDLDVPESESEDVKGGFGYKENISPIANKAGPGAIKIQPPGGLNFDKH